MKSKYKDHYYDRIVFVIGVGLIGQSVANNLIKYGKYENYYLSVNWNDIKAFNNSINRLIYSCVAWGFSSIHVVWSAGVSSFTSNNDECNKELIFYSEFMQNYSKILSNIYYKGLNFHFHLIGSAGGLYEGQKNVNKNSQPKPLRPYGRLKLKQEQIAIDSLKDSALSIYRLSSVYGYISNNTRMGLVTILLKNTLCGHITNIYGNMNTLRDYIFVEDVGRYIAINIHDTSNRKDRINFLVSGTPVTIHRVYSIISKLINKNPYISYSNDKINFHDITFNKNIIKPFFEFSNLSTSISTIMKRYFI